MERGFSGTCHHNMCKLSELAHYQLVLEEFRLFELYWIVADPILNK